MYIFVFRQGYMQANFKKKITLTQRYMPDLLLFVIKFKFKALSDSQKEMILR